MRTVVALATFLLVTAAPAALAQPNPSDVPDMPRPEEITERVNALLDEAPEETIELAGVAKIVYRRVPLDVHAVALKFGQTLSGRQEPRGMDLDRYVRQFEGTIQGVLEQRLAKIGTIEVLSPLKAKGKAIPPGTYDLGLALQNGRPAALVVQGEELPRGRPVPAKVKLRRPELEPAADGALTVRLVEPEEQKPGKERFDVVVAMRGMEAITSPSIDRSAAPDGDDADDED